MPPALERDCASSLFGSGTVPRVLEQDCASSLGVGLYQSGSGTLPDWEWDFTSLGVGLYQSGSGTAFSLGGYMSMALLKI